jgi:hypothetical protein
LTAVVVVVDVVVVTALLVSVIVGGGEEREEAFSSGKEEVTDVGECRLVLSDAEVVILGAVVVVLGFFTAKRGVLLLLLPLAEGGEEGVTMMTLKELFRIMVLLEEVTFAREWGSMLETRE